MIWRKYLDGVLNVIINNVNILSEKACQLEDAMVDEIFDAFMFACCGHRCPHNDMQIGLTNTTDPNILEILISCETETIKRPSRIRLSTSPNGYAIHDSYIGKSVFDICNLRHKSLSKA